MVMNNTLRPYFEVVKKIMDGTPVKELDHIRSQCNAKSITDILNEKNSKKYSQKILEDTYPCGYRADMITLSFVADAENKILQGEDPAKFYSGFQGITLEECRKRGRAVVESMLTQYLN